MFGPRWLSAADDARLRTWALDIVETLLGGPVFTENRQDRKYPGGLCVNRSTGIWYYFSAAKGDYSLVPLIALLQGGSHANAVQWARAWLDAHPGRGLCDGADPGPDEESASGAIREANQDRCRKFIDACVPLEGSPGHLYLLDRLPAAPDDMLFPDFVRWLPPNVARYGEGAIATLLEVGGVVVGVELRFITEQAKKSLIEPTSQIYKLEVSERAKAATIGALPSPAELRALYATPGTPSLLICEGLPDLLSLQLALPNHTVVGLPGIWVLQSLRLAKGVRAIVCRDGDAPGSEPDKSLTTGIDSLLLQGAEVSVTAPPEGKDSNDVLREAGPAALAALVDVATPASLSLAGETLRCADMSDLAYEQARAGTATRLKMRVPALDKARKEELAKRRRQEQQAEVKAEQAAAWDDDINLNDALELALVGLKKHMVLPEHDLAVCVVWAVHAHLCRNDAVQMETAAHLKVQSRVYGSGKTALLEKMSRLLPANELLSKCTPAYFVNAFHKAAVEGSPPPILLIDEADRGIHEDSDMVQLLDGATKRSAATSGQMTGGTGNKWDPINPNFFGPVLLGGVDDVPSSVQERSLLVWLDKALGSELPEHVRTSTKPSAAEEAPELSEAGRHLAAWTSIQTAEPECTCPDLLDRQPDRTRRNWWMLYAIAEAAGGRWPELIEKAARTALSRERPLVLMERLLLSIERCFDAQPEVISGKGAAGRAANDKNRIESSTLVAFLTSELGEEWSRANRGGPVTERWLGNTLINIPKPLGTREWQVGKNPRRHCHGYERHQFEDPWLRYISFLKAGTPAAAETSETGTPDSKPGNGFDRTAEPAAPDGSFNHSNGAAPDESDSGGHSSGNSTGARLSGLLSALREKHPDWPPDKLAKHLHQPKWLVEEMLAETTTATDNPGELFDGRWAGGDES